MTESNIVQLSGHREPPIKSQYEKYPLPFFDADRLSTWAVKPNRPIFRGLPDGESLCGRISEIVRPHGGMAHPLSCNRCRYDSGGSEREFRRWHREDRWRGGGLYEHDR
jgi:hypothetical protein